MGDEGFTLKLIQSFEYLKHQSKTIMQAIKDLLDGLNQQELNDLKDLLNAKINKLKDQELIAQIRGQLKLNGYAWTTQSNLEIQFDSGGAEILQTQFPLYIHVWTCDKEDKIDLHVDGLYRKQNDWVDYMGCDYQPSHNDDFTVCDDEEWDYNDWDDPATGKATLMVQIFLKKQPAPKEGSKFQCFDEDGNIVNWKVSQGQLFCKDRYFGQLYQWDQYEIFVIDENDDDGDDNDDDSGGGRIHLL